jgi:hypothetical protein
MAETPLAKKLVNAINACEAAVMAVKELKDFLTPPEKPSEPPAEEPGKEGQ